MRISKFKKLGENFKIQKLGENFEILTQLFEFQKLGVNSPVRILKIKIWIFFHFFPQLKCGC